MRNLTLAVTFRNQNLTKKRRAYESPFFFNEILLDAVGDRGDQQVLLRKHLLQRRREGDEEGAIFLSL